MAGLKELNYFLGKFVSLWQEEHTAGLQLSATNGEAQLNLHVGLGRSPQLQHQGTNPNPVPDPICLSCWERRQQKSNGSPESNGSQESNANHTNHTNAKQSNGSQESNTNQSNANQSNGSQESNTNQPNAKRSNGISKAIRWNIDQESATKTAEPNGNDSKTSQNDSSKCTIIKIQDSEPK